MFKAISALVVLCLFGLARAAPQAPGAAGLEHLRKLARQSKADPEPWREYGEALANAGDGRGAAKAFGEAVERYVKLYQAPSHVRAAGLTKEEMARHGARRAALFRRAPETIERYIQLGGAPKGFERQQLEAFAAHARLLNETGAERSVFRANEVERKARITSKPEPGFTPAAAEANTLGRIRLRAVLAGDGTVRHVFVLEGLPHGLTELAVAAAHRIKFEPALKDGRPVSQFIVLEYNFNPY